MAGAREFDVIVVGAGMAGASAAAGLAEHARVALLEAEPHAGYHTTGRSAALYSALYGNATIRGLTRASRAALFAPPPGFAPVPLVAPRATVFFGRDDQRPQLLRLHDELGGGSAGAVQWLDAPAVRARLPLLREDYAAGGVLDDGSADLDVDALLQAWLRRFRALGGTLQLDAPVQSARREPGGWRLQSRALEYRAPVVVDACGAWGDVFAERCGVAPIGLVPRRRTALLIPMPDVPGGRAWPAAIDVDEAFYFKPDAGALLLSPADETPSPPCDAQPEEWDVAVAVDRFERATGRPVPRILRHWAGLRVFSPDRSPVVGFDPDAPGFFWLVGQGGYGIQTAPAMARAAAALVRGTAWPEDLAAEGVQPADLSPARFAGRARGRLSGELPPAPR